MRGAARRARCPALCYRRLLARALADGPPQPLHCCPVLCAASRAGLPDVLLSSGTLPCVLAVTLEAVYIFTFSTRMIFNDPRDKGCYKDLNNYSFVFFFRVAE